MSGDMRQVIVPKSDQLNSDDLIAGSMTIKITDVTIKSGQEQPVSIHFEGDNGKPYKACKSMCRVMVAAWGADSSKYIGRSMTLYRDPKVKWAGMEVGGIRISHMSDIPGDHVMALTATRGSKKPYTVKPLATTTQPADVPADIITAAQHKRLEARINGLGVDREKLKAYVKKSHGIDHLNELTTDAYKSISDMLDRKAEHVDSKNSEPPSDALKKARTIAELDAAMAALPDDARDIT